MSMTTHPADKIYNFLKKSTNKFYASQLKKILKLSEGETRSGLKALSRRHMIVSEHNGRGALYYYDKQSEKYLL